jgi:hypothetical protein
MTSELDGGEWSASRTSRFTARERDNLENIGVSRSMANIRMDLTELGGGGGSCGLDSSGSG